MKRLIFEGRRSPGGGGGGQEGPRGALNFLTTKSFYYIINDNKKELKNLQF